jgi:TRAP-type C4-dicarboxylate transport system substrate-binding protein
MRNVIAASALAGAIALGHGGTAAAQTVELKLSHFVPPNHTFHKWATDWAARLNKESGGKVKVTIYPAGQLVGPPNRQFDAARNGITDIAFTLHGVTPGRYPMADLTNLPFSFPGGGKPDSAVMSRRLTELAPKYLAKEHQGLRILMMAVAPPVIFNSKVPVRTLADFKGLKIRYAGASNRILVDTLGAVPLLVPPPEAQDALSKGIVDAAMFPHEAAVSFDLASVAKYAIEPGLSSASFAMVMNPAKYNSLPPDVRALIDKTTGPQAAEDFGKRYQASEVQGRETQIKKGVTMITLPEADLTKLKTMMKPHIENSLTAAEKRGLPAREFYQAYTK